MNEQWFRAKFSSLACDHYPNSFFADGFEFSATSGDGSDDPVKYCIDVIEIDQKCRFHLWQFCSLHAPELMRGDGLGRLIAASTAFSHAPIGDIRARIERGAARRKLPVPDLSRKLRFKFDSWNMVICGGRGCELAPRRKSDGGGYFGSESPLRALYTGLSGAAIGPCGPELNTWHFYQTSTGFDLRSIWDFTLFERPFPIWEAGRRVVVHPADDFDIAVKSDLHLKRRKGFHSEGFEALLGRQGA